MNRFDPLITVYSVCIPGITKEKLIKLCESAEMDVDEYCVENGRYVVRGAFIGVLIRSFVEKLSGANPEFPIKKAHYISPSYKTTLDEPIYIEEDLIFVMQIKNQGIINGMMQAICNFELRHTDGYPVFGGFATLLQRI